MFCNSSLQKKVRETVGCYRIDVKGGIKKSKASRNQYSRSYGNIAVEHKRVQKLIWHQHARSGQNQIKLQVLPCVASEQYPEEREEERENGLWIIWKTTFDTHASINTFFWHTVPYHVSIYCFFVYIISSVQFNSLADRLPPASVFNWVGGGCGINRGDTRRSLGHADHRKQVLRCKLKIAV